VKLVAKWTCVRCGTSVERDVEQQRGNMAGMLPATPDRWGSVKLAGVPRGPGSDREGDLCPTCIDRVYLEAFCPGAAP
jgi:hypothetical protein